jgi:hypothetical protein
MVMKKIEELKKLVEKDGTEKMKELVLITEEYLKGLDNIFKNRDVDQFTLKEFDFPMFLRELQEQGIFENRSGMQVKLLVMDIYYIARHTWELTDERGVLKNGDDLHKAWSSMYEHDEAMTVEALFKDMQHI